MAQPIGHEYFDPAAQGLGRGGKAFVIYCARATQRFLTNNSMQMAAAIAFYSFFSLFPLFLLMLLAFDVFVSGTAVEQEQLTRIISTFIPASQDVVARSLQTATESREATGPIAIVGLAWASTAVFATLRKGINTAWNVWVPRPFLKERVIDLAVTAGAGFLFMGVLITMTALRSYENKDLVEVGHSGGIFGGPVWLTLSSFVVTFAAFTALYRFLPNRKVHTRDVLFGAFIAAAAFEVAKGAFFAYNLGRSDLNQVYGSLSAAAVLLGWLYVSAAIILIGALAASIYSELVSRQIVTAVDIWSFGIVPGLKRLRRHLLPRLRSHVWPRETEALPGEPPVELPTEGAPRPR